MRNRFDHRLIAKHKCSEFKETRGERIVGVDPEVLANARLIAHEWVTEMRLTHILDKLPTATGMEHTGIVVAAMVDDVLVEAKGEIIDDDPKNLRRIKTAIGQATVHLWKKHVQQIGGQ